MAPLIFILIFIGARILYWVRDQRKKLEYSVKPNPTYLQTLKVIGVVILLSPIFILLLEYNLLLYSILFILLALVVFVGFFFYEEKKNNSLETKSLTLFQLIKQNSKQHELDSFDSIIEKAVYQYAEKYFWTQNIYTSIIEELKKINSYILLQENTKPIVQKILQLEISANNATKNKDSSFKLLDKSTYEDYNKIPQITDTTYDMVYNNSFEI